MAGAGIPKAVREIASPDSALPAYCWHNQLPGIVTMTNLLCAFSLGVVGDCST